MCVLSLSVVSDSCGPIDCSLPGSSVHGILQARTGMGCHFLLYVAHIFPLDCTILKHSQEPNQSILKEINTEYSLGGPLLKLKLQYFGHLMCRANWLEKTPMLWKIEGRRQRGWHRMRRLDGIVDSMNMSLSRLWEIVKDSEACRAAVYGVTKNQAVLSDWKTTQEPKIKRLGWYGFYTRTLNLLQTWTWSRSVVSDSLRPHGL